MMIERTPAGDKSSHTQVKTNNYLKIHDNLNFAKI